MDNQSRDTTSPLAKAIVEALVPAPPVHVEEAWTLVDHLLEDVRRELRELRADNNRLRQGPRDSIDI